MLSIAALNWVGIIIAAVAAIVIGSIWYHPKVFGTAWGKEMKMDMKKMQGNPKMKAKMNQGMFLMVIAALVSATILAVFLQVAGAMDIAAGLQVAFWIWVGFYATMLLSGLAFEGMSTKLFAIKAGQYLVALLVMSAILVTWA